MKDGSSNESQQKNSNGRFSWRKIVDRIGFRGCGSTAGQAAWHRSRYKKGKLGMRKKKINLDHRRQPGLGPRGHDDHGGGRAAGHPHPPALLPSRPEPGRLLPRVHRGREGDGLLHGLVQRERLGGHGGADQLARNPPGPARHRRAAAGQPPHGLPDLRARRQLRAAEPGLRDGRARAALRGPAKASFPWTTPATRSSATRKSASSAAAACGSAPRSRASTTSASTAAGSTPSSRPPTWRTWTTRSASSAGSASTSAPRPPSWRSARAKTSGRPWPIRKCTWWCRRPRRSARPSARASACRPARRRPGRMVTALRRWASTRCSTPTSAPT